MVVSYLGITLNLGVYIILLLIALISFIGIWIIIEISKQRKHSKKLSKLKKAELRLIN